jgi:hypothetical protein
MTKATSETTKLNFITDQGSTRATVRCACLAERFGAVCCGRLRTRLAASPGAVLPELALVVLPGSTDAVFPEFADAILPGFAAAGPGARLAFALVSDLRKARAGDDRDSGGGSGISQANAAGDTVVVPAGLLSLLSLPSGDGVPDDSVPGGYVPDGTVGVGVSADDSAAWVLAAMVSAGGGTGAESAGRVSAAAWPSAAGAAGLRGGESVPFGRAARGRPRLSAGRAGTASTVADAGSSSAPSCTVSSIGSSPARSSSGSREVMTVDEALPEPSGLFVRLSKPSSL